MSQILDAINKAEEKRNEIGVKDFNKNNYKSLVKGGTNRKNNNKLVIFILLISIIPIGYLYKDALLSKLSSDRVKDTKPVEPELASIVKVKKIEISKPKNKANTSDLGMSSKDTLEFTSTKQKSSKNNPVKQGGMLKDIAPLGIPIHKATKAGLAELTAIKPKEKIEPKVKPRPKNKVKIKIQTKKPIKKTEKTIINKKTDKKIITKIKSDSVPAWKKNIKITAIVYDEDRSKRFVLINSKKLKRGQKIPDTDFKIISILKQGLILNDGNGEFLLKTR